MNKINNIENEENKNSGELAESHFDEDWHNESINEIEKEKNEQKKSDMNRVEELTEKLFENEKMSVNDFIEKERELWKNENDITINLIKTWYKRKEILSSSLNQQTKKQIIEQKNGIINFTFRAQSFRFNNEKEFDEKFCNIVKESLDKWISIGDVLKTMPLKRTITIDDINYLMKIHKNDYDYQPKIDLSNEVLPDLDWSHSREVFDYLSFDDKTFSQTSKENLPEWYDPKEIFEKGKLIGLWIDDIHKMWYTWKWVSVAICDWKLQPHNDIKTKEYFEEENASNMREYFHASAVSSILCWKQTGVVPESDLYFFAETQDRKKEYWWDDQKFALDQIFQKNKSLPNNKKIKIVSISGSLYWEGIEHYAKKLKESWVRVLSSEEFFRNFCYLQKNNPMWNVDDLSNYQIPSMFIEQMIGHTKEEIENLIFISSGWMTVASPKSESSYRYDYKASASWSIPIVAWYYALACQANPNITPDKFIRIARDKAKRIKLSDMYKNKEEQKHLEEKGINLDTEIRVLDIKALIQKIEEENNK